MHSWIERIYENPVRVRLGAKAQRFFHERHSPLVETMQKYEVRRGQEKNLQTPQLMDLATMLFGGANEEQGKVTASFGALARLTVWLEGKSLCVETEMKTDVTNDVASDTIKRYNAFLEKATGYTAKERAKKAQEKAKKGGN